MTFTLHQGDCIEVMRAMPDNSVDSFVTDPPYHLTTGKKGGTGAASLNTDSPAGRSRIGTGFMGMIWDGGDIAQNPAVWIEALRILKPGGYLLAFSGSRTYHRMACAIEDAGFEIRDQIMWIYGSGFPKSLNLDGDRQGWGTALKPAHEPICMARKPLIGTVLSNMATHGTGALNIDGCRIQTDEALRTGAGGTWNAMHQHEGRQGEVSADRTYTEQGGTNFAMKPGPRGGDAAGRWPANVIHDGSPEVLAGFPTTSSGMMRGGTVRAAQDEPGSVCYGTFGGDASVGDTYGDTGSAARFFYCAKASKEDRNEGLYGFEEKQQDEGRKAGNPGGDNPRNRGVQQRQNFHPTVKPTDLMAYLCRLVTPPGGTVLDPFMGSGSTGKAAVLEGFNFIGIDVTPEYVAIARARIDHAQRQGHQPSLDLEAA